MDYDYMNLEINCIMGESSISKTQVPMAQSRDRLCDIQ